MRQRILKRDNRLNLVTTSLVSLLVVMLIVSSLPGIIPDKSNIKRLSVLADLQDRSEKTYDQFPSLGQGINGVYPWIPRGPKNIYDFINDSGKISALAIDWSDTNIMYLGSGYGPSFSGPGGSGGVYKSINGGKSWTPVDYGLNNTIVDSLLINQSNPNVVIASTYTGGIYKTVDGGVHWYKTAPYLMAFDFAAGGNVVYVPTYSGIAMSTDFGNSWSIVLSTGLPFFAVSTTANGSDVYSVDWSGDVYFSADYGAHWRKVYHFYDVGLVWSITVEPWDPAVVYLAYIDFNNGSVSTFWKSENGGTNWTSYPEFTPNSGLVARSVAFDNFNHSIFYLVGQGFAFKYNGKSFSSMSLSTDNRIVWTNPLNGTQVYVGSDQGLFYTANDGTSWRCISASLNVSMLMDVAAANGGSELQVAVQDYAALYSLNNGITWEGNYPCDGNWPGEGGTVIINPANSSIVYFYTSGVLRLSSTSGRSWITIASFTPTQFGVYFPQGMTVNPRNPSTVYLATRDGVFYSTDWGYNWNVLSGSPKNATVVALDPQNLSKIWVGTSNGLFFGDLTSNKWYSTGLTKDNVIDSIAIDPYNDSIVFVGTGLLSPGTILRSTNYGSSFVNIGSELNINNGFIDEEGYTLYYPIPVTDMLFLGNSDNLSLIVSTSNGIYLSTDLGTTWESLQFNVISSIITGISVSGGNLFISTWGEGVLEYPHFSVRNIPGTIKGDLKPGSTLLVNGSVASVNGSFSLIVPPGTYNLTVLSPGYARSYYIINIRPFEIYTVNITYQIPSKLTALLNTSSLEYGETFKLEGNVSPAPHKLTKAYVYVLFKNNTKVKVGETDVNEQGEFSFVYSPTEVGEYNILIEWPGTELYLGSSASVMVSVSKAPTIIALKTNATEAYLGKTILVSGKLKTEKGEPIPNMNVNITIRYKGLTFYSIVTTNSTGDYCIPLNLAEGSYEVSASTLGNKYYAASSSDTISLTVTKEPITIREILFLVGGFVVGIAFGIAISRLRTKVKV